MASRFILWLLVVALCGFGLVMVVSAAPSTDPRTGEITNSFMWKQVAAMLAGFVAALFYLLVVGVDRLKRWWMVVAVMAVETVAVINN